MNQQRALFYNFTIDNTLGNEEKLLDQLDTPYTEMLPKASDYNVSIIKFTLPNEAETFLIDDDSYSIKLGFFKTVSTPLTIGTSRLENISVTRALTPRSQYKIRSIAEFLENLNRTIIAAHRDLLLAVYSVFDHETDGISVDFPVVGIPGSPVVRICTVTTGFITGPNSTNLSVPSNERANRLSSIKVSLTINPAADGGFHIRFWLVNSAGVSVALTAGRNYVKGKTYTFIDGTLNTQQADLPIPDICQPLEPFSKILTSNDTGTADWKIV